jgi:hypothetical protein
VFLVLLLVLAAHMQIGVGVFYFVHTILAVTVAHAIDAYKAASSSMALVVLTLHHSIDLQHKRVC